MANPPLWFVRAGEDGAWAPNFRTTNSVGIGWEQVGPISAEDPDEEINERFANTYKDKEQNTRAAWANQVRRYLREIRVGDGVVTYDPTERVYLLGRIESDAIWNPVDDLPRRRAVIWTHKVNRDGLSENARNKLGSIATFFRVGSEAEAELRQSASPLHGETSSPISVRGQHTPALMQRDFDVLRRNPRSVSFPTLAEEDRTTIKNLRQRLLEYAEKLRDEVGSTLTLKAFASHPSPSGKNASHYWSCVYPQTAPNKSFAFQLSIIVRSEFVEYGFGSGRAKGEMEEEKLRELRTQFESHRERLKLLRNLDWIDALGVSTLEPGFKFRRDWPQREDGPSEFFHLAAWIDHATSQSGGGAAISKMLRPDEVVSLGDRFGGHLVSELRQFVPLLDAIYSDSAHAETASAKPLPVMPRSTLSIDWLAEETLWERRDIEHVLDTLTHQTPQVILAGRQEPAKPG
jgi:hypothetical protein